ncbi:MAG: CNNM domain-containing protein [Desulfurivibrionaceae bacterium]|nr:CNNM domain-containing protein [Desulfurivibrionaceae bacterium]
MEIIVVTQLIIAACLAIFVSALCSLFEAVLYSVPMSYIEALTKKGRASGKILKGLKKEINQPIIAILSLNTVAHTMGAAIAGAGAAAVFGEKNITLFSIIFTFIILIFSEILPKTAGVTYAKPLSVFIARPLSWMVTLFKPVVFICHVFTRLIPGAKESDLVSTDEILAITGLSRISGEIDRDQEGVIRNIIELRKKTVRQVMTPRTVAFTLDKNLSIKKARQLRESWHLHSRVPVYSECPDDIIGIVLRKDVLLHAVEGDEDQQLKLITRPVHFVPETAPLNMVLLDFFERRQHLFCVVDEYGGFTGVISLEDIIEEIMGMEIMDESDHDQTMRQLARDKSQEYMSGKRKMGEQEEDSPAEEQS